MEHFKKIYEHVINRLETELPDRLTYHNAEHTKYVLQQADFLAEQEQLSGRNLLLIRTAALYHDTGFLIQREDHEDLSCEIAFEELRGSTISGAELTEICGMIKATRIPQSPKTLSEKIVADADLFYLGTDKYEKFSARLFSEMKHFDPDLSEEAWLQIQQKFLTSHRYHTNYGRTVLEAGKRKNLTSL